MRRGDLADRGKPGKASIVRKAKSWRQGHKRRLSEALSSLRMQSHEARGQSTNANVNVIPAKCYLYPTNLSSMSHEHLSLPTSRHQLSEESQCSQSHEFHHVEYVSFFLLCLFASEINS